RTVLETIGGRPGLDSALGCAAGADRISGRAFGGTEPRPGLDPIRCARIAAGPRTGSHVHADLLPGFRHQCGGRVIAEHDSDDCRTDSVRSYADAARYRGHDPDDRYGSGLQRADL